MRKIFSFFAPAKTVPVTSWPAPSLWAINLPRLIILPTGVFLMGIGGAMTVQSDLGNPPWTVLAQGLSFQLNIPLGWAFFSGQLPCASYLDPISRCTRLWHFC